MKPFSGDKSKPSHCRLTAIQINRTCLPSSLLYLCWRNTNKYWLAISALESDWCRNASSARIIDDASISWCYELVLADASADAFDPNNCWLHSLLYWPVPINSADPQVVTLCASSQLRIFCLQVLIEILIYYHLVEWVSWSDYHT